MALAESPWHFWKRRDDDDSRLVWAFVLSLAAHVLVLGTYEGGKELGVWQAMHLPRWLHPPALVAKTNPKLSPPPVEVPLVFVDVNPAQAVAQAPKNAKYYSDKNSRAANPNPAQDTKTAEIDGKQKEMVKTEDVPRSKAFPLNPTVPAPKPEKEEQIEEKPKATPPPPGDLALAKTAPKPAPKPEVKPQPQPGEAARERPRTLKEALARMPNSPLAGEKLKQAGGVRHAALQSSLDVAATPFGAYDAALIAAVQNRWYSLLDSRNFAADRTGRVTLSFKLHADGSVSEIDFVENTVGVALGLICQSAIKDPSPYAPWPSDMRREIGAEYRDITFTFIYY